MAKYSMFRVWNTMQQLKVDLNVLTEKIYIHTHTLCKCTKKGLEILERVEKRDFGLFRIIRIFKYQNCVHILLV